MGNLQLSSDMETNISMQQLKQQRMSPAEKFVLEKIKGVKPDKPNEFGNVWWHKDSEWLFEQDSKSSYLWVSNNIIWFVLEDKYGLNYNEILQLLTKLLHKYTNNGQLTIMV
jgi:hypothetical protein